MARRDDLLELLRPPAHRGPLIAAGAVLFTVGIALEEVRLDDVLPNGLHVLILALAAALIYGLGVQARLEGGAPAAYQSVLIVCGLLLLEGTLLELASVLGADFDDGLPTGALVWTSLLLCGAAAAPRAAAQLGDRDDDRGDRARRRGARGGELDLRGGVAGRVPLAAAGARRSPSSWPRSCCAAATRATPS